MLLERSQLQVMPHCTSHSTSRPRFLFFLSLCILQWLVLQFEKTGPPEEKTIHTNLTFKQRTLKLVGISFTSLFITTIHKIRNFLKNKVEKKFHAAVDESHTNLAIYSYLSTSYFFSSLLLALMALSTFSHTFSSLNCCLNQQIDQH